MEPGWDIIKEMHEDMKDIREDLSTGFGEIHGDIKVLRTEMGYMRDDLKLGNEKFKQHDERIGRLERYFLPAILVFSVVIYVLLSIFV